MHAKEHEKEQQLSSLKNQLLGAMETLHVKRALFFGLLPPGIVLAPAPFPVVWVAIYYTSFLLLPTVGYSDSRILVALYCLVVGTVTAWLSRKLSWRHSFLVFLGVIFTGALASHSLFRVFGHTWHLETP